MKPAQDGLIINVASIAGVEPMKSTPVYAASKWGLRGWSLSCYEVSDVVNGFLCPHYASAAASTWYYACRSASATPSSTKQPTLEAVACMQALRQENVKVVSINPAAVATDMTEGKMDHSRSLQTSDIAEAAMLAVRTSSSCVPQDITLRLTLSAAL